MNAINPAPSTASAGNDQRPYEPSMEEILASIRRIIADDQSLPGRTSLRDMPAFRGEPRDLPVDAAPAPGGSQPIVRSPVAMPPELEASLKIATATASHGYVAAAQVPTPEIAVPAPSPRHATEAAVSGEAAPARPTPRAAEPEDVARSAVMDVPEAQSTAAHAGHALQTQPMTSGNEEPQHREPPHQEPADHAAAEPEDETDSYFDPPIERDDSVPRAENPAGLFSAHTKQSVSTAFNVLAATRLADNSEELLGLARDMIRPLLKTWLDDNLPSMVERMVRAEIERVARGGR